MLNMSMLYNNTLKFNHLLRASNLLNPVTEKHWYVDNDIEKLRRINFRVAMQRYEGEESCLRGNMIIL